MDILPTRNTKISWIFPGILDVPSHFQSEVGGHSILAQTLYRRGLTGLDQAWGFLDPGRYSPAPPTDLPGISPAVERIQTAITTAEPILIWGDFDVDGQTSTTLLYSALRELGARVRHYIPNRASESHGISLESLAAILQDDRPGLILTCDTGIDAWAEVEYANSEGVDVIITDHHQLPDQLPRAYSIINPTLLAADHALASLPGVGVAYKLIEALYAVYDRDPEIYLDLVALGIVADVAQLTRDTRYLLQVGLPVLQQTSRLGLQLLYEHAKLSARDIGPDQISYAIAPRLNALGRLADANSCIDFFTSSDPSRVSLLAKELESLNLLRQEQTERIFLEAQEMIRAYPDLAEDYPVLVVQGPSDWNPGVVGIVASRLVERYHKPAILLTSDGDQARGSARSIPGIHISDLIHYCQDLLDSHGGHPMAAGLSLALEKVPQLRRELASAYEDRYGGRVPTLEINLDGELPFQSITADFIVDFARLAPFGAGNPKLLFATRNVHLEKQRTIGKKENHRKLSLIDSSGARQDFLWWNSADIKLPEGPFDIAYELDLSTYRGERQIQATLQHFRPADLAPVFISKTRSLEILDHRKHSKPLQALAELASPESSTLIWSERNQPEGFAALPREAIRPTRSLIVWTIPPSLDVLKSVVDRANPDRLVLFAEDPSFADQKEFLEALLGLLKFAQTSGKTSSPALFAQRLAMTSPSIETGLDWLTAHGDYDLNHFWSENLLKPGPGQLLPGFEEVNRRLSMMLHEIKAYRSYYQSASMHALF